MTCGKLYVIEGVDGAGKGVQARMLWTRLTEAGVTTELHHEPTGGAIGELIRRALTTGGLLPGAMRMLFAADRAAHSERIAAALKVGTSVVCDRYDLSNLIRSWAEEPTLEALDWTHSLDRGIVLPDITIVLQAPLDVCLERIAARGKADIYETREMQAKVHEAYAMATTLLCRDVAYVDASGTPDEVAERVWAVVEPMVRSQMPEAA
jgi:dTMP kinase